MEERSANLKQREHGEIWLNAERWEMEKERQSDINMHTYIYFYIYIYTFRFNYLFNVLLVTF